MGHPKDAVMRQYALYFAIKLDTKVLAIHDCKILSSRKPDVIGKAGDDPSFCDFINDCQDRGIEFETLPCEDSWQKALNNADQDRLIFLPFGKRFRLPDFNLENYLAATSQPVVFCPDDYIDIESIGLAYDGSVAAKRALDLAVWFSYKANWPLSVLMVADSQDQGVQWMDEVEACLDSLPINSTTIILSGTTEKALDRFMKEGSVELLIMSAYGRHREQQIESLGQATAFLIEQAAYPLLLVS
jgi:nucleotide-binding universal stress UspA family protein